MMNNLFQLLGLIACLSIVQCEFLGGTIFWMFEPSTDEVRLIYRLSWKKGTGPCGPGCNVSDIGTLGSVSSPSLLPLSWNLVTPASSLKVSDVNYVVTSVSIKNNNFAWEHGENRFTVKWSYGDEMKIRFDNIPWILSGNYVKPRLGAMETIIKYGIRADTKRMNASPYVSIPSMIGIPIDCESMVQIPVEDMDGDVIKCRLAMTSECADACTNLPDRTFWIDQTSCSITIYSYPDFGYVQDKLYRLTLVVEDFPRHPTTRGTQTYNITENMSTVPIQLTIHTTNGPCHSTRDTLQFVKSTPPHHVRQSYKPRDYLRKVLVNNTYYLQGSSRVHISNSEAMVSAPASLQYSYQPDDLAVVFKRTNVMRIDTQWAPNICDQKGPQQICVWGIDNFGVTTDPRCKTYIIGDDDDFCALGSATCDNYGKCVNIYKEPAERCDCLPGYTSYNCEIVTQCDPNPCHNGKCVPIPPSAIVCLCDHGYEGYTCEHKVPPCDMNPCLNFGTCYNVVDSVGDPVFRCRCPVNFEGDMCQDLITTPVTTLPTTSISSYLWTLATSKLTALTTIGMTIPPVTTGMQTPIPTIRRTTPLTTQRKTTMLHRLTPTSQTTARKTTKGPVTSPTTSSSTTTTTATTSTTTTSPMSSTTTTTVPTSTSTTVKTTLATTRPTTRLTTTPSTTTSSTTTSTTQSTSTTTYPTFTTTATIPTTRKPSTVKPTTRPRTPSTTTARHIALATTTRVTTKTPTIVTRMTTQNVPTTTYISSRNITPVCRPNRIKSKAQALNDSKSKDDTMFIVYVSIGGVAALSVLVLAPCLIIACYKRAKNRVKPFKDSETSKERKKHS